MADIFDNLRAFVATERQNMDREAHNGWISAAIMGWGVAILMGVFNVGISQQKQDLQVAAIEHGCAAYDTQTGEWGWKR